MKLFKKALVWISGIVVVLYITTCCCYYFLQPSFLFTHTRPASADYRLEGNYEERFIQTRDGTRLHGLLFKADSSKGLILYLHGSGYALDKWAAYAKTYTGLQYDIFFLDYRGYGKSEGEVPTEAQLYTDAQDTYDVLKQLYPENRMIVFGYSLGTGPAAYLAAHNSPGKLILQAPYYSMPVAVRNNYPFLYAIIPDFLLKYKIPTYAFVKSARSPVVVLHGDQDSTFNIRQAYALQKLFKPGDELVVMRGQGHNNFTGNPQYVPILQRVLELR